MEPEINFLPSTQQVIYAIDAESANKQKRTGVESYAFQLIQAMKQQPLKEGERVFLYSPTPLQGELAQLPSDWESHVLDWPLLRWPFVKGWMQGRVSWELLRRRPHVFFVPSQGLPRLLFGVPIVTTIHDIGFRRIGNLFDTSVRHRLASIIKRSSKKATHLLTVSEFTKQELKDVYHVRDERVTVTHLAADTSVYHRLEQSVIDAVLRKHRLGHTFFLSVGRLEKKKNTAMLIRAFELFKQHRGIGDPFELVLVGEPGFGYAEIKELINQSSQKELIREVGYVSDEEVAALMNTATAFCFPSWYEGFGIPLVEAMSCGAPLMISDIPVHHEVAGEAAVFISPKEPESWAKQMAHLVDDSRVREQLIESGNARVQTYDWNKTAQATWERLRTEVS